VDAAALRLFLSTGGKASEYLKIARAGRLPDVGQFRFAGVTQEQMIRIYKGIAFGQLTEFA
jgi:hypothetical protein